MPSAEIAAARPESVIVRVSAVVMVGGLLLVCSIVTPGQCSFLCFFLLSGSVFLVFWL
jgi:hypothetical protein